MVDKSLSGPDSHPVYISASDRLRDLKESIVQNWMNRIYHEIPAAREHTESQLRNSLPRFLEKLTTALAEESFRPLSLNEVSEISQIHGEQRASLKDYSLRQMLKEYQILREVIFSSLESKAPVTNPERDIILSSIEEGMTEAGSYFEKLSLREGEASSILVDGIRDYAIIRSDSNGLILDWNRGAENLLGWKKDEVINKNAAIIFTEEDRAANADKEEQIIAAREGKAEDKRWHVRKDGSRFFVNGIMNSLIDNGGNVFGFIKVLRDDTEFLRIEEEKKRALENAEISHRQLYDFFMHSPTPLVILEGPEHLFKLANAPYENLVHRKVNGKTVLEAFSEEEIEIFIPMLDSVYRTGKPFIGREQPMNIPGEHGEIEQLWVNVNYFPHFDDDGKVKGILCDVHDVTDQVKVKMKIQESEERFRLITNTIPSIVWTALPDGMIDWQSDKYEEYTGLGPETNFKARNSPLHPDDVAVTIEKWRTAVSTGRPYELEHRLRRKSDGVYRWNLAKGLPVTDADGNIIQWIGSTTDIHDLKIAQQALKKSEEQFRTLANSLPQIVWTANTEGLVDWYNDWWYKYLNMPRDTRWDDANTSPMHPEDVQRTWPLWKEALATGKPFNMEQRFRRGSDGQYRWHLVRGVAIKDDQGKILRWVGANTDIHDHRVLVGRLEEEHDLRQRFVAALSHDLRTPLTSAKLSAQVLRRSYSNDEKVLRASDRIVSNLDRVDWMIQDLLDASRLSAGEKLPLKAETCELTVLVHNTIEELRHIHGNRFEIVEEANQVEGNWDIGGIRRILENLCNNAVKYGDEGPIIVTVGCDSHKTAIVSIHNTGNPVPPDELKNLFEPFRRSSDAQASDKKGWGIGLMLVKGVVDAHGGFIEVISTEEDGTTFTVYLPVARSVPCS